MSWNHIMSWDMLVCLTTCKEHELDTGYTVHVEDCPIGKQVEERKAREKERESSDVDRGNR